jgi:SAM-dependent methyltransferase
LNNIASLAFGPVKRLFSLWREAGLLNTIAIVVSGVDDRYLKRFDRKYGIDSTAFIELDQTSFERSRLVDATNYGPVNGWALRGLLRQLELPTTLRFVDLGCGKGRACIIAAEYGFERVTGVELVGEFCTTARENAERCHPPSGSRSPIVILQMDVFDYCVGCDDDVFFMYRPFSETFLSKILSTLTERARAQQKRIVVIYAERVAKPSNYSQLLTGDDAFQKVCESASWGQQFWVYSTGPSLEVKRTQLNDCGPVQLISE